MRKLKGHRGDVYAVLVFQKWVLSAGYDKTIRVWSVGSGQLIREMVGHSSIIRCLTAIPPSMSVVSGSWDNTIKIWNIRSGALLSTLEGHSNRVKSVIYHQLTPDRAFLISGSDDCTLKLWDVETYSELRTYTSHSQPVLCVAAAMKEGQAMFASGSADHSVQLLFLPETAALEATQSSKALEGHRAPVTGVVFSGDSSSPTLYSCSEDLSILLWDCNAGYVLQELLGHTGPCQSLAIFTHHHADTILPTRTERLVSTSLDGSVRIWSTTQHVEERKLDFTRGHLFSAAVGPEAQGNGHVLVLGGDEGLLQMYPDFVDTHVAPRPAASGSPGRREGSNSSASTRNLPSIGRNAKKSLAIRLPMKQLSEGSTTLVTHYPSNDDQDQNSLNTSSSIISGRGSGRGPSMSPKAGALLSTKNSAREGLDSSRSVLAARELPPHQLHLARAESGPRCALPAPSMPPPSVSALAVSSARSLLRARPGHSKQSLRSPMQETVAGIASRGAGDKPRGKMSSLPRLANRTQHRAKEFICVTSQYTEPPEVLACDGGAGGLLNCNSLSF